MFFQLGTIGKADKSNFTGELYFFYHDSSLESSYPFKLTNTDNENTSSAAPCSLTSAFLYRHTDTFKN